MNIKSIICKIRGYHIITNKYPIYCKTCGRETFTNGETIRMEWNE